MLSALDTAELPVDAIEVARVADAWGIRGWFKLVSYSADPQALYSSKRWYLLPAEKGLKTFSGCRLLRIKESKDHAGTVVASAHDIVDRNAAEALRGARVFVARSSFPTASADEYYWIDLLGLQVVNRQDEILGTVRELLSTGAQTVLVLQYGEEDKPQERMIPFVAAYIDSVDLPTRCIRVDWLSDY